MTMDTVIIIPAFNEEDTVAQVIREIHMRIEVDILVVNDGSRDRTSEIAHALGVTVIDLEDNQGIGVAMKTGYQYAYAHGYQYAIQVDADGQHDLHRVNDLLREVRGARFDMAIGSRYIRKTHYQTPFLRRFGIRYFSALLYILHGKRVWDTTSGYRVINRKVMRIFLDLYPDDYPEVPTLSYLLQHNYRVCEIPVEMKKRQGGKSSINFGDAFIYMIKTTAVCLRQYFADQ